MARISGIMPPDFLPEIPVEFQPQDLIIALEDIDTDEPEEPTLMDRVREGAEDAATKFYQNLLENRMTRSQALDQLGLIVEDMIQGIREERLIEEALRPVKNIPKPAIETSTATASLGTGRGIYVPPAISILTIPWTQEVTIIYEYFIDAQTGVSPWDWTGYSVPEAGMATLIFNDDGIIRRMAEATFVEASTPREIVSSDRPESGDDPPMRKVTLRAGRYVMLNVITAHERWSNKASFLNQYITFEYDARRSAEEYFSGPRLIKGRNLAILGVGGLVLGGIYIVGNNNIRQKAGG